MSEFQYYEFQKIDGQLSFQDIQEVKEQSSRAKVNRNQAVFVYNFGDFRGEPENMLASYFDAMLYVANWGSKRLSFRLPKHLVDIQELKTYEHDQIIRIKVIEDSVILNLYYDNEDGDGGGGWIEEADVSTILSSLSNLRKDILMKDYRCLYLTWLSYFSVNDPEMIKLPMIANLQKLSPELSQFVDFFEISTESLKVVASKSKSEKLQQLDVNALSNEEMRHFLEKVVEGDPLVQLELNQRLQKT